MPRIPILRMLGFSPFDRLKEHAKKIKEGIGYLGEVLKIYSQGKFKESEKIGNKVVNLEHEADIIKGEISSNLPSSILLPVDRKEFLALLSEQDAILNYAEDAVIWLHMRDTPIPKEVGDGLIAHLNRVLECVEVLEEVVSNFIKLVSRPDIKTKEKLEKLIKDVHRKEWEDDQIGRELAKRIFSMNINPLSVYHLIRFSDLVGEMATHAENAVDRITCMITK